MVVSLIFKDPEKEDTDEPPAPHLQDDQEWLHKQLTEEEMNDPKKMADLEIEGILEEEDEDDVEKLDTKAIEEARITRYSHRYKGDTFQIYIFMYIYSNNLYLLEWVPIPKLTSLGNVLVYKLQL